MLFSFLRVLSCYPLTVLCYTLFEYLDRKQLLMSSAEQSRLLNEVPKAIPDIEELEPASADDKQVDNGSPRTILIGTAIMPSDNLEEKGTSISVTDVLQVGYAILISFITAFDYSKQKGFLFLFLLGFNNEVSQFQQDPKIST